MQITSDPGGGAVGIWRGLAVVPENLCALYDRERDYPYPSSVEQGLVRSLGGVVYGFYTARSFGSTAEINIDRNRRLALCRKLIGQPEPADREPESP